MTNKLNHCRDSGASGFGGTMGGMRRGDGNRATCPTCGKRVQITRDGRLRAHGTKVCLSMITPTPAPVEQRCDDCDGPTRRAFPQTPDYRSCRRCGHVFPTRNPATQGEPDV